MAAPPRGWCHLACGRVPRAAAAQGSNSGSTSALPDAPPAVHLQVVLHAGAVHGSDKVKLFGDLGLWRPDFSQASLSGGGAPGQSPYKPCGRRWQQTAGAVTVPWR